MASRDPAHPNHCHNATVLQSLRKGDRVKFEREMEVSETWGVKVKAYSHWGIYAGDGDIIHLAGGDNDGLDARYDSGLTLCGASFDKARVVRQAFWDVVGKDRAYRNNDRDKDWTAFSPDEIINNAMKKMGQMGYNLMKANCEHFTNSCRYGIDKSDQVDSVMTGLAVAAAAAAAIGLVHGLAKFLGGGDEQKEKKKKHGYDQYTY